RKVTKNRGHFPSTEAAVKLLWLAICNIEDKRALEREKERGKPASQRRASGRLVEGQTVTNWKQALAQLTAAYPDRINPYLCTPPLHRPVDRPTDTASPGRSEIDTIARKGNSVNSPMMIRGMWIRFRRTFIEVGTLRRATCPEGRGVNGGRWPERLSKGPPEEPSAAF